MAVGSLPAHLSVAILSFVFLSGVLDLKKKLPQMRQNSLILNIGLEADGTLNWLGHLLVVHYAIS